MQGNYSSWALLDFDTLHDNITSKVLNVKRDQSRRRISFFIHCLKVAYNPELTGFWNEVSNRWRALQELPAEEVSNVSHVKTDIQRGEKIIS